MSTELTPLEQFNKEKEIVNNEILNRDIELVKNGYQNYYIGQRIQVVFNDNDFKDYQLNVVIIDLLIEKKENFALLVIPENREQFFPDMNELLKEYGIDNLTVPKNGCFLCKHIGNDRFILENEEKEFESKVNKVKMSVLAPKLFIIPTETLRRLLIYKKLLSDVNNINGEIKKILE